MERNKDYTNTPRWIRAKYASRCACGRHVLPGQWICYHPSAVAGKRVACEECSRQHNVTFVRDAIRSICKAR